MGRTFPHSEVNHLGYGGCGEYYENPPHLWDIYFQDLAVLPVLLIGASFAWFFCFRILAFRPVKGYLTYFASFGLIGINFIVAVLVRNILYDSNDAESILVVVDMSLQGCVAISFVFDALVDFDIITETSALVKTSMVASYALSFIITVIMFLVDKHTTLIVVFVTLVAGCYAAYVVIELLVLVRSQKDDGDGESRAQKGFILLLLMMCMATVIITLAFYRTKVCDSLGDAFGGAFLRYLLADLAIIAMYRYFLLLKRVRFDRVTGEAYFDADYAHGQHRNWD